MIDGFPVLLAIVALGVAVLVSVRCLAAIAKPKRVVVKVYGYDRLIAFLNPVMTLLLGSFGIKVRLQSDEQVIANMEADARKMRTKGYRVVASEEVTMPLGVEYLRVTYELVDPWT